jgi:hypothetical protein
MKKYGPVDLFNEIMRKRNYNGLTILLKERPTEDHLTCTRCGNPHVPVIKERFGDGTPETIYWVVNAWMALCRGRLNRHVPCQSMYLWFELIDQEEVDRENRRLLEVLCDQELKRL